MCVCVCEFTCVHVDHALTGFTILPLDIRTFYTHFCIRITTKDKAWNCNEGTGDVCVAVRAPF